MRVIVFPHDLEMGGSQLGALQLAAGLRDRGVESIVFGRPGALNARIEALGLEFVEAPRPGRRPSPAVVRALAALAREREADIVHGYEWPPTLEAVLATRGLPATPVSTVMSMAVAPFIPTWVPLVVGTAQIAAHERAFGRPAVHLMVPPVDLATDVAPPAADVAAFRARHGLGGHGPVVAIVCRLVPDLKLEGIRSALTVAAELAPTQPFQLLIVGDGSARAEIERSAAAVNAATGRPTVVLTGQLPDPRVAYAAADLSIGMGSSALRALAFGLPLIVQGEQGFFAALGPDTLPDFRWQGWFGHGAGVANGPAALTRALLPLLADERLRAERARFGRQVVEDASLERAVDLQLRIYTEAIDARRSAGAHPVEDAAAVARLGRYYADRLAAKLRGTAAVDDFNAVTPVPAAPTPPSATPRHRAGEPLVYVAGSHWHDIAGTDRQLVEELARRSTPILWVDPPRPWRPGRTRVRRRLHRVSDTITRLEVVVPPALTRPGFRSLATRAYAAAIRRQVVRSGLASAPVLASSWLPVLPTLPATMTRILYATDDVVAGAGLWGMSAGFLHAAREANLRAADQVLAVSPTLADLLRRGDRQPVVFPNACDAQAVAPGAPAAAGVRLAHPIAGFVGQLNERTDLTLLTAARAAGLSLLIVGPRAYADPDQAAAFERLAAQPGVQWVGRVHRDELAGYLAHLDVGLTPHADTPFNRGSDPLKTMDYLAAGVPVVVSATTPPDRYDPAVVRIAATPAAFARQAAATAAAPPGADACRAEALANSWSARADQLLDLLTRPRGCS